MMTTDAMGMQTKIAEKTTGKKTACCLAHERNHFDFHEDEKFSFENQTVEARIAIRENAIKKGRCFKQVLLVRSSCTRVKLLTE